jgi:hypothetical protein
MRRLQGLTAVLCLTAAQAALASPEAGKASSHYYPKGVDRQDGMSVDINLHYGYLRITSDGFDATPCADQGHGPCFSSGYMSFAPPSKVGESQWQSDGKDFMIAGACSARIDGARVNAMRIVSEQHYGRFEFYYDPVGRRLLGWRLDYRDEDGKPAHDLWMTKGVARCKPEKPAG